MSKYDIIYKDLVEDIIENGLWDKDQKVRTKWVDGSPAYTKSIISKQIKFDNREVPILTTKRLAWKTAIHELLWFYVRRTSNVLYLQENNVKIWEEWTRTDGTIGKAYGYQLGKPMPKPQGVVNQVDNLIYELKITQRHADMLYRSGILMIFMKCRYILVFGIINGLLKKVSCI